jgi:catechol 2,3-dioxygenase-like lactoylglutathione lyase family enzyme
MKLGKLQHFTIRASKQDFAAIERFYADVLGLRSGYRPPFEFDGLWLYHESEPILHVAMRRVQDSGADTQAGVIDHVAFLATGAAGFAQHLQRLGVAFEQQNVARAGYQIFLRDPVGTRIEINFDNAEAPR